MHLQPFSMEVDLPEILCLMVVSKMFYTWFADTAFYSVGQKHDLETCLVAFKN